MKVSLTHIAMGTAFLAMISAILTFRTPLCGAEVYGGEVVSVNASEGTFVIERLHSGEDRSESEEMDFRVSPNPAYPDVQPLSDLETGDLVLVEAGGDGEVDSLISGWDGEEGVILIRGEADETRKRTGSFEK